MSALNSNNTFDGLDEPVRVRPTAGGRHGLAIGSTGTFPGGLAADLARCPFFIIIY